MITFKEYALGIWKNPTNEKYLLDLQNNHNINVIFALWCGWKNHIDSNSDKYTVADTMQTCEDFAKQYILPLREKRKSTPKADGVYSIVMEQEITKELELISILEETYQQTGNIDTTSEFKNITGHNLVLE